jgi:hypothetical protein
MKKVIEMTIEEHIAAHKLDAYKDRTGDYSAKKIPTFSDFIQNKGVTYPRKYPPSTISKHGLTRFDYWRMEDKQNMRCAICGELPGKRAMHLDHDHITHKIRGLICHGCNIALGMIKDDPETARAMADYIEKHRSIPLNGDDLETK